MEEEQADSSQIEFKRQRGKSEDEEAREARKQVKVGSDIVPCFVGKRADQSDDYAWMNYQVPNNKINSPFEDILGHPNDLFSSNVSRLSEGQKKSEESSNQIQISQIGEESLLKNQKNIANQPQKGQISQKKSRKGRVVKKEEIAQPPSQNKRNMIVTKNVDFVPVDNYFPMKLKAKVIEQGKDFLSITLTQSNLAKDNNKFFIIQALQTGEDSESQCYLFTRWGRVGVRGQLKYNETGMTRRQVIRQYNIKSQQKVNKGGYKVIDVTYQQKPLDMEDQQISGYLGQSKLSWKVQELVKLIFDRKMMQFNMKEIGYDQKRSPLGLIAKKSIEQGYISLDKIMKVIKNQIACKSQSQRRRILNQYSGQFYSAIPHDFGYLNMQAFVLNTEQKVKQKLQMLASLSQIQIYSELMGEKANHPQMCDIDIKYLKLKCSITQLQWNHPSRQWIKKYIENTHAETHGKYVIELMGVFGVEREEERKSYRAELGNKMMLWHGSRLSNYVGILSQGLKIAPLEAPATGYMFGKGIYFADIVSKSANYCRPKDLSQGLLMLCEVALGQMNDKLVADFNAHHLPEGYHSTRGVGKYAPDSSQQIGEVVIPNGRLSPSGIQDSNLKYNEYVVYSCEQVLCRYLVRIKFHFK